MTTSRCGVQCGVSETVVMIGGSKNAMASELCQIVAFVSTNTRSLVTSSELTVVDMTSIPSIGFRCIMPEGFNGMTLQQIRGLRKMPKAVPRRIKKVRERQMPCIYQKNLQTSQMEQDLRWNFNE